MPEGRVLPDLSVYQLEQAIVAHFPRLTISSISLLAEGWANRLCLVNNRFIFRCPMDAGSERLISGRYPPAILPWMFHRKYGLITGAKSIRVGTSGAITTGGLARWTIYCIS
ncbi:MAG: hypothetical protein P1S60_13770 [Anaerolineae bacterium]|nr:hypothetical protein [Anaerolineae bacterium]